MHIYMCVCMFRLKGFSISTSSKLLVQRAHRVSPWEEGQCGSRCVTTNLLAAWTTIASLFLVLGQSWSLFSMAKKSLTVCQAKRVGLSTSRHWETMFSYACT